MKMFSDRFRLLNNRILPKLRHNLSPILQFWQNAKTIASNTTIDLVEANTFYVLGNTEIRACTLPANTTEGTHITLHFKNETAIRHNDSTTANIPLFLVAEKDIVVKANARSLFVYREGKLYEIFGASQNTNAAPEQAVTTEITPSVGLDFNKVVSGSSIELYINGTKATFTAGAVTSGTTFAFDNNSMATTATNFKTVLDAYLVAQGQTANYTTSRNSDITYITSTRAGDQYQFLAKVNNVSVIHSTYTQNSGGGATLQNFNYTIAKTGFFVVDFYPAGNPDLATIKVNSVAVASTSMLATKPALPYTGTNNYFNGVYTSFGVRSIHELIYNANGTSPITTKVNAHYMIGKDLGTVPTRLTEFADATGITDISQPSSLTVSPHTGTYPQRIWAAVNAGDAVVLTVAGGSSLTGYTFKVYEVNVEDGNDIQIVDGNTTALEITAEQVEIIANNVVIDKLQSLVDMQEPTGFSVDPATGLIARNDSQITWDNATRTMTIAPKAPATSFSYYVNNKKFVVTTPQIKAITDTEGNWHFYFDETGTIIATQVFAQNIIYAKAYIANGYWDATNKRMLFDSLNDERHGNKMDGHTHAWIHNRMGTRFDFGLALNTITANGNGTSNAHAQFGVDAGLVWDEEIDFSIDAILSTVGLPILYHLADGKWRQTTRVGYSILSAGTGRMAYNPVGSALVEVANGRYAITHVFATSGSGTDTKGRLAAIVGQNQYNNSSDARDAALTEVTNLITTGLSAQEFRFIGSVIFQTSDSYSNAVKSRIVSVDIAGNVKYVDLRKEEVKVLSTSGLFLSTVSTDATLSGNGTPSSPLKVVKLDTPAYKGDIASNADFAAIVTRTKYDQYTVVATATDAATGQTFSDGAEIYWSVTAWELIGNIDIPLKKIYINQTYTIAGEIKVAVGQTDAIIPFRMPIISGTSAKIVKVGYGIGGGTNAVFRMQKNGLDITAIGTKTATTIYTIATLTTTVGLADMDKIQAVISSVLDTPTNLGIDLIIEITL